MLLTAGAIRHIGVLAHTSQWPNRDPPHRNLVCYPPGTSLKPICLSASASRPIVCLRGRALLFHKVCSLVGLPCSTASPCQFYVVWTQIARSSFSLASTSTSLEQLDQLA